MGWPPPPPRTWKRWCRSAGDLVAGDLYGAQDLTGDKGVPPRRYERDASISVMEFSRRKMIQGSVATLAGAGEDHQEVE